MRSIITQTFTLLSLATTAILAAPTSIWKPRLDDRWQIAILGDDPSNFRLAPNIKIIDVDLIDAPVEEINKLKAADAKIICYFSAGTYEDWREDWKTSGLRPQDTGNAPLDGDGNPWPGENYVRPTASAVQTVMLNRIQLAADKGCDAIDPDNVDGYTVNNGLGLTQSDYASYVLWLADAAHKLNLAMGLKNAADLIPQVLSKVEFDVQENCHDQSNCQDFAPFATAGKPVFNIEYTDTRAVSAARRRELCATGNWRMSTLIKEDDLGSWTMFCDGTTFE